MSKKIGRPKTDRQRFTIGIDKDVADIAEQARLRTQAREGMEINKVDWFTRLVRESVEQSYS